MSRFDLWSVEGGARHPARPPATQRTGGRQAGGQCAGRPPRSGDAADAAHLDPWQRAVPARDAVQRSGSGAASESQGSWRWRGCAQVGETIQEFAYIDAVGVAGSGAGAAELSDVRVLAVDRSVMTKMVSGLLYPPLHARTSVNRSLPPGRLRPAAAPENVDAYGEGSDRSARGR